MTKTIHEQDGKLQILSRVNNARAITASVFNTHSSQLAMAVVLFACKKDGRDYVQISLCPQTKVYTDHVEVMTAFKEKLAEKDVVFFPSNGMNTNKEHHPFLKKNPNITNPAYVVDVAFSDNPHLEPRHVLQQLVETGILDEKTADTVNQISESVMNEGLLDHPLRTQQLLTKQACAPSLSRKSSATRGTGRG